MTAVRGTAPLPDIGPYAGPIEPVYCVSFDSGDVFGPGDEPAWTLCLDLSESYLEQA